MCSPHHNGRANRLQNAAVIVDASAAASPATRSSSSRAAAPSSQEPGSSRALWSRVLQAQPPVGDREAGNSGGQGDGTSSSKEYNHVLWGDVEAQSEASAGSPLSHSATSSTTRRAPPANVKVMLPSDTNSSSSRWSSRSSSAMRHAAAPNPEGGRQATEGGGGATAAERPHRQQHHQQRAEAAEGRPEAKGREIFGTAASSLVGHMTADGKRGALQPEDHESNEGAAHFVWDSSHTSSENTRMLDGDQEKAKVRQQIERLHVEMSKDTLEGLLSNLPKGEDGKLMSIGSGGHDDGQCKPCLFVRTKVGCQNGVLCEFCHFPHKRKNKPRPCKGKRDRYRKLVSRMEQMMEDCQEGDGGVLPEDIAANPELQAKLVLALQKSKLLVQTGAERGQAEAPEDDDGFQSDGDVRYNIGEVQLVWPDHQAEREQAEDRGSDESPAGATGGPQPASRRGAAGGPQPAGQRGSSSASSSSQGPQRSLFSL